MIEAVIFDYNRTLVFGEERPPKFYPGTLEVLKTLKERGIKMAVVSVGEDPNPRLQEFEQLGLREYISIFRVVGKNDRKDLPPVLEELGVKAQTCLVVGDRVRKEIVEGNRIGAITVWLEQGEYAEKEKPQTVEEQPTYKIKNIEELFPIIDSLSG